MLVAIAHRKTFDMFFCGGYLSRLDDVFHNSLLPAKSPFASVTRNSPNTQNQTGV